MIFIVFCRFAMAGILKHFTFNQAETLIEPHHEVAPQLILDLTTEPLLLGAAVSRSHNI
jgi:hypothetical protein